MPSEFRLFALAFSCDRDSSSVGEGRLAILEDLVTTAVYRAIVPAGYIGQGIELWYVRLLPPPIQGSLEHVVFTTPYIVVHPQLSDWLAYFRRTFPAMAGFDDYERHMKYGPSRDIGTISFSRLT